MWLGSQRSSEKALPTEGRQGSRQGTRNHRAASGTQRGWPTSSFQKPGFGGKSCRTVAQEGSELPRP